MAAFLGRQATRLLGNHLSNNVVKVALLSTSGSKRLSIFANSLPGIATRSPPAAFRPLRIPERSLVTVGHLPTSLLAARSQELEQRRAASNNMLVIRRKKMKKHKRRKRYKRDHFKMQKYHQQKKMKAETLFRERMNAMIHELETFDPLEHVKDTMRRAKREWEVSLVPSGRKKYPHWSEMMSLEELYGLPPDDRIDKTAGRPSPEDQAEIDQRRADYFKRYTRKAIRSNGPTETASQN